MKLYDALKNHCPRKPRSPALYYMGKTFFYADMMRKIDEYCGKLASLGIKEGDTVTICMPNVPQCVYAFYAVNKIGAKAHLVHPLAPVNQLGRYMERVGSKLLITLSVSLTEYGRLNVPIAYAHPAGELNPLLKLLFDLKNAQKTELGRTDLYDIDKIAPSPFTESRTGGGVLLHSGGTGGEPKVIVLSDRCINALAVKGLEILGIDSVENKYMLGVLPIFHGFGLAMGMHSILINGGVSALMPRFNAKAAIKLINKDKLHFLIGVPALYEALLKNRAFTGKGLKNIYVSFVGGDCVSPSLLERFDARIAQNGGKSRLFEGYGLTETVTVCSVNTYKNNRTGSAGKALSGLDIIVTDPDTDAVKKCGESGQLCVCGETLMDGYLNDPQADAEVFFEHNGKVYVKTGDCGAVDEDGYVYFKQRLKRIIKIAGISVYPSEIESIAADFCGCSQACAVDYCEQGKTYIALFLAGKKNTDDRAVQDKIQNELSRYAVPKRIVYIDEIPKTLIGKADVNKLKEMLNV